MIESKVEYRVGEKLGKNKVPLSSQDESRAYRTYGYITNKGDDIKEELFVQSKYNLVVEKIKYFLNNLNIIIDMYCGEWLYNTSDDFNIDVNEENEKNFAKAVEEVAIYMEHNFRIGVYFSKDNEEQEDSVLYFSVFIRFDKDYDVEGNKYIKGERAEELRQVLEDNINELYETLEDLELSLLCVDKEIHSELVDLDLVEAVDTRNFQ